MRDFLQRGLAGILRLPLFAAIATRAGWIVSSFPRPQGTGPWMFSRATGLLAYAALSLDVIVGLLVSTRSADRILPRGQLVDLHGWLSPVALLLVLGHGAVLIADSYARFDLLDLVLPFASRWPIAVGLGVVAGYLVLAVHLSFRVRKRIGTAWWRRLHYLSFVSFVLVTIHAIAAGTDRANAWFTSVYAAMLAIVVSLLVVRLRRSRSAKPAG